MKTKPWVVISLSALLAVAHAAALADSPPKDPPQTTQDSKATTIPCLAGTGIQNEQDKGTATITLRMEAEKQPASGAAGTLKSIADLVGATAWPLVFIVLLVTQKQRLGELFVSVVDTVGKSTRVKLGEIIDLEVDRSAKKAEQSLAQREVPPEEREAAARVDKLVDDLQIPIVRQRMQEFAREYDSTRANLKPGKDRTRAMNAIVAKMRTLALAAKPLLPEFSRDENSPGNRLVAITILQLTPSLDYVPWLVKRMEVEQPFVFFHASLALLATVRAFGSRNAAELKTAVERSLDVIQSFTGGRPDLNTVQTLELALSELHHRS